MRSRSTIPFLLAAAIACADELDAPAEPVLAVEARAADGAIVDVAPRLYSAPELDSLVRAGASIVSFAITPDTLRLTTGEAVPLSRLAVDARTAGGEQIGDVPLQLALDAAIVSFDGDSLRAGRAGETILWVSPLVVSDAPPRVPIRILVAPR